MAHEQLTEISLSSVDEKLDTGINELGKQAGRVVHAVTLEEESLVDLHVARLEFNLAGNAELYTSALVAPRNKPFLISGLLR